MTPVTEETLVLCMILALAVGALVGFALGYILKEKKHDDEIAAVIRITKWIHWETPPQKERAPQSGAPHDISRIRF
jgi:hypothetical protein